MAKRKRYYGIGNQIIIAIVFFSGMMLNYFLLAPIIDKEETARITSDLNDYASYYTPYSERIKEEPSIVDSLRNVAIDPYAGDFFIIDSDYSIIYNSNGLVGDARDVIRDSYGETASELIIKERTNPLHKSRILYDKKLRVSFFADYETEEDILFFYVADYNISGGTMVATFHTLLFIMIMGGLVIIILCLLNIRKLTSKVVNEISNAKELETASSIQKSMLPRGERHLLQLDIHATLIPAKKVGGDFYYYQLSNGFLYFCIGDVAGKGVPASLSMSRVVSLFRSLAMNGLTPSEIISGINREMCTNNDQNIFVTAFVGVMDVTNGSTRYCNAGHDNPIFWSGSSDDSPKYLNTISTLPLGFDSNTEYNEGSFTIEKNGLLLFYTDGVTEARSKGNILLGKERLLQLISQSKQLSAKEIDDYIVSNIAEFEKGMDQSDDITLMTFRNIARPKTLVIENDIRQLKKISSFTEELFNECPMDTKTKMKVRAALDEALTNCVHYAYDKPNQKIELRTELCQGKLIFTIKDSGIEFNPTTYCPKETDDLQIGGLGIPMMKSTFDEIQYRREGGNNNLTLIKRI